MKLIEPTAEYCRQIGLIEKSFLTAVILWMGHTG